MDIKRAKELCQAGWKMENGQKNKVSKKDKIIVLRNGWWNSENRLIAKMYLYEEKTLKEIGNKLNLYPNEVLERLKKMQIPRRIARPKRRGKPIKKERRKRLLPRL
ncbi:MAG: hypothetical protein ACOCRX_12325 [Candidatus Woesearchaeota archaeon]